MKLQSSLEIHHEEYIKREMALSDGHAKYLRKKEIRLHFSEIVKAEGEFLPYACLRKSPVEPSFSLASGMDLPVSSCLN